MENTFIQRLITCTNDKTILGMAIIQAVDNGAGEKEMIDWIQSQSKDNPVIMYTIIGETLTKEILAL